jgi:hypothetical protein
MKKIIFLLFLSILINCSSLVIRNDDSEEEVFGKVISRIILVVPTLLWSEVYIRNESLKYEESLRKISFDSSLNSYIGKSINNAIENFGYKYKEIKTPNGDVVFEFNFQSQDYVPPTTYFQGNVAYTYGGYTRTYFCDIFFVTNKKIIKKSVYQGNNCY